MENRGKNIMSSTNEGFEKTLFKIESLGKKITISYLILPLPYVLLFLM